MRALKLIYGCMAALALFIMQGCTDPSMVIDDSRELPNHNWSYINRVKFDVKIDDASKPYNLYLNLRVGGTYKYSNIFILFKQTSANKQKVATTRYEFKMANADGEWLGSGSGNLYSYQLPLRTQYKFPVAGTYHFEIEQNMRDNPLHDVSDVGLRVEKAQ